MDSYSVRELRAFVAGDWEEIDVPPGLRIAVQEPGDGIYRPGEPGDQRGQLQFSAEVLIPENIAGEAVLPVEIVAVGGERWRATVAFHITLRPQAKLFVVGDLERL